MSQVRPAGRISTLFSEGFRVFFLSAAIYAILAIVIWLGWLAVHAAGGAFTYVPFAPPPSQWHAHEMIFGYGAAVVAGFFLTAVPSWTGSAPSRSTYVTTLAIIWFTGRMMMLLSSEIPALLVMAVDVIFVPILGFNVLANLLKRPKPQNMLFMLLLGMLTASNLMVHFEWGGLTTDTAPAGLRLGLLTLASMIAVLGGRVTPGFTRNAMTRSGIETGLPVSHRTFDLVGIASAILLAVLVAFETPDPVLAIAALIAALANAARLAGWRTRAILDQPILWSLHLGFAMLVAGYTALAFAWAGFGISETAALHLISIGAVGGMTLAVMTRAALGHTGRPLVVAGPIAFAYVLMALAALVRSIAITLAPDYYFTVMFVSGGLWIAVFIIFIAIYAPIVTGTRIDARK